MPHNRGVLWEHFENVQRSGGAAIGIFKTYFKTFSIKNMDTSEKRKEIIPFFFLFVGSALENFVV